MSGASRHTGSCFRLQKRPIRCASPPAMPKAGKAWRATCYACLFRWRDDIRLGEWYGDLPQHAACNPQSVISRSRPTSTGWSSSASTSRSGRARRRNARPRAPGRQNRPGEADSQGLRGRCARLPEMRRAEARDRSDRRPGRDRAHPLLARALAPAARVPTFAACRAREPCARLPSRPRHRLRPAQAALAVLALSEFAKGAQYLP